MPTANLCPMVDSVDEIATYVPADMTQKQPLIQRIHDRLAAAQLPRQWPKIADSCRAAGSARPRAGEAGSASCWPCRGRNEARAAEGDSRAGGQAAAARNTTLGCRPSRTAWRPTRCNVFTPCEASRIPSRPP